MDPNIFSGAHPKNDFPKMVEPPAAIRTCGIDFSLPDPLQNGVDSADLKAALFYIAYAKCSSPISDLPDKLYRPFMAFVELAVPLDTQLPAVRSMQESRYLICRRIKQAMVDADKTLKLEFADFYQAHSGEEEDTRHPSVRDLDGHVDWIAGANDAYPDWDEDVPVILRRIDAAYRAAAASETMRCSLEFIHALCTMGQTTDLKLERYKKAAREETGVKITLSVEDVETLFHPLIQVTRFCNVDMRRLMDALASTFPAERCARVHLTIKRASYNGASGLVIVNDAMVRHPSHPVWKFVLEKCRAEVEQFAGKIKYLAQNPFVAYQTHNMTMVQASTVPNLRSAAICIKRNVDREWAVTGYRYKDDGRFRREIEAIIKRHEQDFEGPSDEQEANIVAVVTSMNQFGMLPTE